jgi:FAD/FMN-containing dehydrogenase
MVEGPKTFVEAIDVIEETYEFLLAYAAQGRRREEEEAGSNIRERLERAEGALGIIASATMEAIPAGVSQAAAGEFFDVVKADAARARAAFRFVLAQRSIGSQVVDNLNATTHVRTLLTDLFLLDEAAR